MTKSLFTSRTFWVAMLQAAIGIVVVFSSEYPGVGQLVIAKSLLDITLRIVTETKVV